MILILDVKALETLATIQEMADKMNESLGGETKLKGQESNDTRLKSPGYGSVSLAGDFLLFSLNRINCAKLSTSCSSWDAEAEWWPNALPVALHDVNSAD